jgi:hypothetical protein
MIAPEARVAAKVLPKKARPSAASICRQFGPGPRLREAQGQPGRGRAIRFAFLELLAGVRGAVGPNVKVGHGTSGSTLGLWAAEGLARKMLRAERSDDFRRKERQHKGPAATEVAGREDPAPMASEM